MSTTTFAADFVNALAPAVCKAVQTIPHTERAVFWYVIGYFGFWGWVAVILGAIIWGAVELVFRFGGSANGCTRLFNVFVGSLTFAVFQALLYLIFEGIFGDWIYCTPLPNISYFLVFPAVWLFLIAIGFWVY